MEFCITKSVANTLINTFKGEGSPREFLEGSPDLYFDVSKGVVLINFNVGLTLDSQMVANEIDVNDLKSTLTLRGNMCEFTIKVIDDGFSH